LYYGRFQSYFKKHDGTEDDEHRYYGSVFIMLDHIQTKELANFNATEGTVSAEFSFSFSHHIIPEGKQFVCSVHG
jgi:hypothetical protein